MKMKKMCFLLVLSALCSICGPAAGTTIFEEMLSAFKPVPFPFFAELSYGANYFRGTASSPALAQNNTVPGIGIGFRYPLSEPFDYFTGNPGITAGYYRDLVPSDNSVSYVYATYSSESGSLFGGLGINYSFWNGDVRGQMGLQAEAGSRINENYSLGGRLTYLQGSSPTGSRSVYGLAINLKYHF